MKGEEYISKIIQGDTLEVLKQMPDEFVDCIITSPPYWGLRDYGIEGQLGLEPTLEKYIERLLAITAELKRVLKPTGVMFWNHGDSYGGAVSQGYGGITNNEFYGKLHAHGRKRPARIDKCLNLQNYRLIFRMIDEQGWILRNIIIWHKPNHMPSSVKDRFANAYEPVFMLVKSKKYWFDLDAVRVPHKEPERSGKKEKIGVVIGGDSLRSGFAQKEGGWSAYWRGIREYNPLGKNPGDVWTIPTQPFPEAHFATFPEKLIEPMIKAGCPQWICKKCGEARKRISEVRIDEERVPPRWQKVYVGKNKFPESPYKRSVSEFYKETLAKERVTIGWTDCGCNAGWRPGIVLDPFMGSGTTAVVARKLGRYYIGIELNPNYITIANKRLAQQQLF